jgi:hypothetical protein
MTQRTARRVCGPRNWYGKIRFWCALRRAGIVPEFTGAGAGAGSFGDFKFQGDGPDAKRARLE